MILRYYVVKFFGMSETPPGRFSSKKIYLDLSMSLGSVFSKNTYQHLLAPMPVIYLTTVWLYTNKLYKFLERYPLEQLCHQPLVFLSFLKQSCDTLKLRSCIFENLSVGSLMYGNDMLKTSHFNTAQFVSYLTVAFCLQMKRAMKRLLLKKRQISKVNSFKTINSQNAKFSECTQRYIDRYLENSVSKMVLGQLPPRKIAPQPQN